MARGAALYFGRRTPRQPISGDVNDSLDEGQSAVAPDVSRRELKRNEVSHSGEKCPE